MARALVVCRGAEVGDRVPGADRRAVAVHALRTRDPELFKLYSGMNTSVDRIRAEYTDAEWELLADSRTCPPDTHPPWVGERAAGFILEGPARRSSVTARPARQSQPGPSVILLRHSRSGCAARR